MSAQELAQLRGVLAQGGVDFTAEPTVERVNFDGLLASFPQDESLVTTRRSVGGVSGLWADGEGPGVLLYLHGGGYTLGSAGGYGQLAASLARAAGVALFSADYRLAPEHPHPAALEDALAAYRGVLDSGVRASDVVVAGDSAGGGLTIALLVAIRDAGLDAPAAAVVLSPWVDLSLSGPTVASKAAADPSLDEKGLSNAARHYLAGADPETPTASPLFADLTGLPPLLIEVGEAEILLSDATRLAAAAGEAGVDVRLHVWPGMVHDWAVFAFMLGEGRELIAEVGGFVRTRVSQEVQAR
ncbi:alpha/beta hydrolase [Microbacterium betulae]|uniref:Alpha/beta hydrolase n=1 Tax=Microbacterium betulae TaxID=2981139 RepID=A0AA97I768_9MICO|nr:alpha/beta hydrolase [Microbacterium sp. AB]WOF23937.1 alpha/beta hydrolase [Microbacterium sp. AB]